MGQARVLDERLVSGIKQDQRAVAAGVIHPGFQLFLGGHCSGGVVGEAEVNQIHGLAGDLGGESVVGADREIGQPPVAAFLSRFTGAARHHVGVHIHGIHRIGYSDAVAFAEDVEDVAAVAFGAVGDEDLFGADVAAAGLEVVLGNGLPQPAIALFGAITVESFGRAHRIDGGFHRFAAGQRQRFGHIADAQPDQCGVRVGGAEGFDPTADFREQVARFELEVIAVDLHHGTEGVSAGASCPVDRSIRCSQV